MSIKKTKTSWKKGDPSPNPVGRKPLRYSARTVKGMVERFIKRNITPNKLQAMYDGLKVNGQLEMLLELLPYCAAKQSALSIESNFAELSEADLNKLYNKVVGSFTVAEVIETDKEPGETRLLNPSNFSNERQD